MEKIIEQLKAAIAAEKTPTSALVTINAHVQAIEERLAEHRQQTAPPQSAAGVPPAGSKAP